MIAAKTALLGYVAQPRRGDGKLDALLRGESGKVALFGIMGDAYRAIHGDGVVHEKHGRSDEDIYLFDLIGAEDR